MSGVEIETYHGVMILTSQDGFSAENNEGFTLQRDTLPLIRLAIDAYWTPSEEI